MYRPFFENQEVPVLAKQEALVLNPRKVLLTLSYMVIFLALLSITGQWLQFTFNLQDRVRISQLTSFLDLNEEKNLPTFFASIILLIAAALLLFITYQEVQRHTDKKYYKFSWGLLAGVFFYLSIDEYASIHERLTPEMHRLGTFTGWLYHAWVIPAFTGVVILGLFFLKFIMSLPYKTRNQFIFAAILYIGGSLGMELLGSQYIYYQGKDLNYALLTTIEETLEMFGVAYFIYALLCYIQKYVQDEMSIKFTN